MADETMSIDQMTSALLKLSKAVDAQQTELERLRSQSTVRTTRSETQGKLALALSKAQGAMENAAKDALNPFYSSKYADLASVWSAVRKPLSDNELAIFATVLESSSTKVSVETRLHHSSDEWCSTVVTLPITAISKDREKVVVVTAQHIGSALTYARRYGLQCVTGNAPKDDDDGNMASGKTSTAQAGHDAVRQMVEEGPPPASPPRAQAKPASPAVDYAEDGSPMSERAKVETAIYEAVQRVDEKALTALVERVSKMPEGDDKVMLRKAWALASKEIKKLAAKPAPAFAGEKQSDRDATAAMDAALYTKKPATPPAEVTNFPEPGSEG